MWLKKLWALFRKTPTEEAVVQDGVVGRIVRLEQILEVHARNPRQYERKRKWWLYEDAFLFSSIKVFLMDFGLINQYIRHDRAAIFQERVADIERQGRVSVNLDMYLSNADGTAVDFLYTIGALIELLKVHEAALFGSDSTSYYRNMSEIYYQEIDTLLTYIDFE